MPAKPRRRAARWLRVILLIPLVMILLLILAVGSLYIPGVLDAVAGKVLPMVGESSGMKISADDIRLRFPFRLSVSDVMIVTAQTGDTMLTAGRADVEVRLLSLLRGHVGVDRAQVTDASYRMGGRDSLYVGAVADSIVVTSADLAMSMSGIDIGSARLAGARVRLFIGAGGSEKTDTAPSETDMVIKAGRVELARVDYSMSMTSLRADTLVTDTIDARISSALLEGGQLAITPGQIDIDCRRLAVDAPGALYGKAGIEPLPGLDPNWLSVSETVVEVQDFVMRGAAMTVPVVRLHTRERCGLTLDADGVFAMDSAAIRVTDFRLLTAESAVTVSAEMGLDSVPGKAPLFLSASAGIGLNDVALAMPSLAPSLAPIRRDQPLCLRVSASGTMRRVDIDTLSVSMSKVFDVNVAGYASGFMSAPDSLVANLTLSGSLTDPGPVSRLVKGVRIPPLSLRGKASADAGRYAADITARTAAGRLALKGTYAGTAPVYSAHLRADSFPVGAFMPDLGVGAVFASVDASGRGFSPWSRATSMQVKARVDRAAYRATVIRGVTLDASLDAGKYNVAAASATPAARFDLDAAGDLLPRRVTWRVGGRVDNLDLRALGFTDSVMNGHLALSSVGMLDPQGDSISVTASLRDFDWMQGRARLAADSLTASLVGGTSSVAVRMAERSMSVEMDADTSLTALLGAISDVGAEVSRQIASRSVNADSIGVLLPSLRLKVGAGADNLINDFLRPSQISFRRLDLTATNSLAFHARARLLHLLSGKSLRIDTLTASVAQRDSALALAVDVSNRPGTFDEFARVGLRAGLSGNLFKTYVKQQNISGATGYSLGLQAAVADSLVTVNFTPLNAVIAYKDWSFNEGNFVSVNPHTLHVDADLDADGQGSRVRLFTDHEHGVDSLAADHESALTLKVTDVKIQDWLSINPFAPPVAGNVSADMNIVYDQSSLDGSGSVKLEALTYGKERVGDFDLGVDVNTTLGGVVRADVALMVDSVKTITATGALNDSTKVSPFMLDFSMIRLPLRIVNPFLPPKMARLSGALNGRMEITGTLARPRFDGYVSFDSASVRVPMIGSGFAFSDARVPVDSNVVRFNNFAITGSNKNALLINGTVDMASLSEPVIDLMLNARDMMIVNSKKRKGSEVYGKAYIDLDATVRGNLRFLDVDASLSLLPRTDVTYILSQAGSQIGLQNTSDMVRFVNFNDTAAVAVADSVEVSSMQMMLDARLDIEQGSTIALDLSADGKNRAQIKGDGVLTYTMTPLSADGRLTGRFNINDGYVRYSLPVISEKNFSFNQGGYVSWTGDMMNPAFSISAVDQVRANVTQQGADSRLVNFDVTLSASGTLENMDVAFDLSTIDDISVQNELRAMSSQQRANQAMNLLLYNVYSGPNTSGNANLSGNALYGFLTSQLNTWAANTIKGVDVQFGLDQYDSTRDGSTSTATQYSYKVSKSLFNNRFKIVVGGNYSTDASQDENLSQNLISDISFEYLLNDAGSMYVRLFRHTGFESILEGEITQTGVGFVLKRKISRLGDLFRLRRRPSRLILPSDSGALTPKTAETHDSDKH